MSEENIETVRRTCSVPLSTVNRPEEAPEAAGVEG
jgi:hypothetical protein